MAGKRVASSDLNHENWDREEEPEEAGTFKTAPEEELKKRVIKKARRKTGSEDSEKESVFASFAGFKNTEVPGRVYPFSFLLKSPTKVETDKNAAGQTLNSSKDEVKTAEKVPGRVYPFSFLLKSPTKVETDKNAAGQTLNSSKDEVKTAEDESNEIVQFNKQFLGWISKLVDKQPKINLTTYLMQYEKALEKLSNADTKFAVLQDEEKFEFKEIGLNCESIAKTDDEKPPPDSKDRLNVFASIKFPAFSLDNTNKAVTAGSSAPLFNFDEFKSSSFGKIETNLEIENNVEPPKTVFKAVIEEDSVYSKKCKVFIKHDGNFTDRGIGMLYLKPVKDTDKTQLIVRADTNLGNILLNFILSEGLPCQRMGKNNVMIVCIPTPEGDQKPNTVLIRVKTEVEADELLENINKHKK